MAGREVREYTNLSDPKDKKWGKGKDKIDDEDITFQRMVAKMEFLITCPGRDLGFSYRVGDASRCRKLLENVAVTFTDEAEQMEAEEDAERLLRRTEKRAFAAFKKAASLADSSPASVPLPRQVEPKAKSGIRQHDLLKNIVEIRPKRHRVSSPSDGNKSRSISPHPAPTNEITEQSWIKDLSSAKPIKSGEMGTRTEQTSVKELSSTKSRNSGEMGTQTEGTSVNEISSSEPGTGGEMETKPENAVRSLLGLAYESSDEDE